MKTIILNLEKTPRPHYLVSAEVSDDFLELEGKVIFPLSDPSIGDRKDHVNVAHHTFAAWNAAWVLSQQSGCKRMYALKTIIEAFKITKPDTEITIIAKVEYLNSKKTIGKFTAEFYEGKILLAKLVSTFSAWW